MADMQDLPLNALCRAAYPQKTLVIVATVALVLGISVYALDRDIDSTRFLPYMLHLGNPMFSRLPPFTDNLPSFFHVYAFVLYAAAIVNPRPPQLLLICVVCGAIEFAFELFQGSFIFVPAPLREFLGVGVYDPLDIVALMLGIFAAYFSASVVLRRSR